MEGVSPMGRFAKRILVLVSSTLFSLQKRPLLFGSIRGNFNGYLALRQISDFFYLVPPGKKILAVSLM